MQRHTRFPAALILPCLAFAALVLVSSRPAAALPAHGGTGGNPFSLLCGLDEVMVGLGGRYGTLVDAVKIWCKKVSIVDAAPRLDSQRWTPYAGGPGGSEKVKDCNQPPRAVVGLVGRSGTLVDNLTIRCATGLQAQGERVVSAGAESPQTMAGSGTGGSPFDDVCPSGEQAWGLKGRAGQTIDQVELVCRRSAASLAPQRPRAQQLDPQSPLPAPIKVEATDLSILPTYPRDGDRATVKLTIKNTGTGVVEKVPWAIHLYGNQTLAQGEQTKVGPGASFEVTASWKAKAGRQTFSGYVDPTGKTFQNTAPLTQRERELIVTVTLPAETVCIECPAGYSMSMPNETSVQCGTVLGKCEPVRVGSETDWEKKELRSKITGGALTCEQKGGSFETNSNLTCPTTMGVDPYKYTTDAYGQTDKCCVYVAGARTVCDPADCPEGFETPSIGDTSAPASGRKIVAGHDYCDRWVWRWEPAKVKDLAHNTLVDSLSCPVGYMSSTRGYLDRRNSNSRLESLGCAKKVAECNPPAGAGSARGVLENNRFACTMGHGHSLDPVPVRTFATMSCR